MSRQSNAPPSAVDRFDQVTGFAAALILSIAATLSSYAGFQAQLWDGEQAANYTLAEQARTTASEKAMVAAEVRNLDILLFSQWLNAYAAHDDKLQRFYRGRFRPAFEQAFQDWLQTHPIDNPEAALTPLEMGSYAKAADQDTRKLQREAENYFAIGGRANDISDAFGQATVIFALCLFLGGVAQSFNRPRHRATLLFVAIVALVWGIAHVLVLPALRLAL